MKVKLLAYTKDPEQVVAAAIRQCYASVGARELKQKIDKETRQRLIRQVLSSGHTSTLEHASFTFAIEGVSRVTEIHLIRHRVGASFSIQSGRYVKRNDAKYVIPQAVKNDKEIFKKYKKVLKEAQNLYTEMTDKGIKAEDARYLQPQSVEVKIVVTMNARALLHFFELRCCKRAQWEVQQMANLMMAEVKKVAPTIFEKAGPTCLTEKICWEGEKMSCGLYKNIKGAEVRTRI
ncbi:MAG: FAD-dependent thymidylate synthase [Candidatus Shapirobacteria bacterium]|jgi:thymidylate synthase (FAD)